MRKVIFDPEEGRPAEGCTAEPVPENLVLSGHVRWNVGSSKSWSGRGGCRPRAVDAARHPDAAWKTRPVTVHVMLKNGQYTGETTVKQTSFGITLPRKSGRQSQG
jgi:hypothetical protein